MKRYENIVFYDILLWDFFFKLDFSEFSLLLYNFLSLEWLFLVYLNYIIQRGIVGEELEYLILD